MPTIVNGKPAWFYEAQKRSAAVSPRAVVKDFLRTKYTEQEIHNIETLLATNQEPLLWVNTLAQSEEEGLACLCDAGYTLTCAPLQLGEYHLYQPSDLDMNAFEQDPLFSEGTVVATDCAALSVVQLAADAAIERAQALGYFDKQQEAECVEEGSATLNADMPELEEGETAEGEVVAQKALGSEALESEAAESEETEQERTEQEVAEPEAPANTISVVELCAGTGNMTLPFYTTITQKLQEQKANVALQHVACEINTEAFTALDARVNAQEGCTIEARHMDARRFREDSKFDVLVLDAPCVDATTFPLSDNDQSKVFHQEEVVRYSSLQKSLFLLALGMMKPGSVLLYTTTSLFAAENEEVIRTSLARSGSLGTFELVDFDLPHLSTAEGEEAQAQQLRTTGENMCLIAPGKYSPARFIAKIARTS